MLSSSARSLSKCKIRQLQLLSIVRYRSSSTYQYPHNQHHACHRRTINQSTLVFTNFVYSQGVSQQRQSFNTNTNTNTNTDADASSKSAKSGGSVKPEVVYNKPNYVFRFVSCSSVLIIFALLYTGKMKDITTYFGEDRDIPALDSFHRVLDNIQDTLSAISLPSFGGGSSSSSSKTEQETKSSSSSKMNNGGLHQNVLPRPSSKSAVIAKAKPVHAVPEVFKPSIVTTPPPPPQTQEPPIPQQIELAVALVQAKEMPAPPDSASTSTISVPEMREVAEEITDDMLEQLDHLKEDARQLQIIAEQRQQLQEQQALANQKQEQQQTEIITAQQIARFEAPEEVIEATKSQTQTQTQSPTPTATPPQLQTPTEVLLSEAEEKAITDKLALEALIDVLNNEMRDLKVQLNADRNTVERLEFELKERTDFLNANLQQLEDGRRAYEEVAHIYEEMSVELQESIFQQMERMEDERKGRMDKLSKFSVDIRVIENVLRWYEYNTSFFMSLANLNNIVSKMESKLNNGQSFAVELDFLLKRIPNSFVSHQLLANLRNNNNCANGVIVSSHQQLFDRFTVLEKTLRQTTMTPKSSESLWANVLSLLSWFMVSEPIYRRGSSNHKRISRAGYCIKSGDLQSSLNELNFLPEDILYPAQDWLSKARQRLLAMYAIRMIKTELLSRSLCVIENDES